MVDVEPVSRVAPPLRGPTVMSQGWRDLTFVHWAVDPGLVAPLLPRGVRPDLLEDRTYVGLVPFRMVDVGPGRGPGLPWVGTLQETNVRVYSVDSTGRRGVVFLSMDTDRAIVVAGARAALGLPYRWAWMRCRRDGDAVTYQTRVRRTGSRPESRMVVRVGAARQATFLDDFLSARWGLHVRWCGRTLHQPVEHPPWRLREAEVVTLDDELVAAAGFPGLVDRPPDHVAFSDGVDALVGPPHDARRPR